MTTELIYVWDGDGGWKAVGAAETPLASHRIIKFCAIRNDEDVLHIFVFPKDKTRHKEEARSALRWLRIPQERWKEVFVGAGFAMSERVSYDSESCRAEPMLDWRDQPTDPEEAHRMAQRMAQAIRKHIFRLRNCG